MRDQTIIRCGVWAAVLALPLLAGCGGSEGPPRKAVSGTVSLDGQPLPSGMIRFIPSGDNRGPAAAAVIENGAYELPESEGPVLGAQRVEIEATNYHGFAIDDEAAYAAQVEQRGARPPKNPIPETYNRSSTLSITVTEDGPQEFNFPLSSQAALSAQR